MVDGPDLRVPNLSPVRPPGVSGVPGVSGGVPAKGEAGAPAGETRAAKTPAVRTGLDSLELTNRFSISEMPVSILSDAILTRSEWGWRRFLSDFAAELRMGTVTTGNPTEKTAEPPQSGKNVSSSQPGQSGRNVSSSQAGQSALQSGGITEHLQEGSTPRAQILGQQTTTDDRTNLSLLQALNQIRAMQQRELATQGGVSGAPQSHSGTDLPLTQQPQPGPSSAQPPTRMIEGGGPEKVEAPDFTKIVMTMRQVIDHVARLPEQQTWQVNWPRSVDSPQLLPFAKVHDANIPSSVLHPLREWTLSDRLNTAVQDAGGPMFGGGLCFVPSPIQDSSRAIRWRAHRSTFVQEDGKKVHRLVVDIQVRDRPARVTIVSMAAHLAVHLETNDKRLRTTVPTAEQDLSHALLKSGFILQSLSVGDYRGQGQGGSSDEP